MFNEKLKIKNFNDINNYLISNTIKISIKDYLKYVCFYLFKYIDNNIITKFFDFSNNNNEFKITYQDLIDYNIINNNIDLYNSNCLDLISKCNLKLDKDYRVRKQRLMSRNSTKIESDTEYKFSYRALKKCLIILDSNYLEYYLILEQMIHQYSLYQNDLFNKLIEVKDIKLDTINNRFDNQENIISDLSNSIKSIIDNNRLIYNNINSAHDKINILFNSIDKDLNSNVNILSIYRISKTTLFYIDCDKNKFDKYEKQCKLQYFCFNSVLNQEYNPNYINIISKLKYKFNDSLTFFNSEIILNDVPYKDILEYIKIELSQFN